MILKGFKQKSIKKYINKLLSQVPESVADGTIDSLGIIFNLDEIDDFEWFKELSNIIKIHPNKLKIIAFSSKKEEAQERTSRYVLAILELF